MKTLCLILGLSMCFFLTTTLLAETNPPKEDLGYDVYEGKTNKIDHIGNVDARYVWVIYEGGKSGRKIPRAELPPQLKAKYPYDPKKAAESIATKSEENQAQLAMQKKGLQLREADLVTQINKLKEQGVADQKEIDNLNRQIKTAPNSGAGRRAKAQKIKLVQEQDDFRKRADELNVKLKQVRAQLDALH